VESQKDADGPSGLMLLWTQKFGMASNGSSMSDLRAKLPLANRDAIKSSARPNGASVIDRPMVLAAIHRDQIR
jgi:hypothetical protein